MDVKLLDVIDKDDGGEEMVRNDRSVTITFSNRHPFIFTDDSVETPIG
jgi:hypothetical protein